MQLRREEAVFVLTMDDGENRMNADFVRDLSAALDEVEASDGDAALVTTGGGKFYSNGLDLTWLLEQEGDAGLEFVGSLLFQFARLMAFPVPTVAAMNGHTFAAGAMMALAHDYRVMRSDRGFFCLPEIDIQIPFVAGMTVLIRERLRGNVLRDAVIGGRRFSADDAVVGGFVDTAAPEERVLSDAIALAASLAGKDRATTQAIKRGTYAETLAVLEDPAAAVKPTLTS